MNISFASSLIQHTDYYSSTDCARGLAWLIVRDRVWHLLLPEVLRSTHVVQAYPQPAEEEPDGWQWCLDVDDRLFPLPLQRIDGSRPPLPDRGTCQRRQAILYTAHTVSAGLAAFGGTHGLQNGLQSAPHRLWLTHGIKVGYKPSSSHSHSG